MNTQFRKVAGTAALLAVGVNAALAQVGWDLCIDPANPNPRSNDYIVHVIQTELFGASAGVSGTTTYGGANGPCYGPTPLTANHAGRYGFFYGAEGSLQTSFDNNMILTMGMPLEPMGTFGYATTVEDGTRALFGGNGISLGFVGESDHYMVHESTNGNVFVRRQIDLLGDAARVQWTLTNIDTTNTHNIGLWTGHWIAMLANEPDATGAMQSHTILPNFGLAAKFGYTMIPGAKPPYTDQRYIRALDPETFPSWVEFLFGQTSAYGMRVDNGPTAATLDETGQSETEDVLEFALGQHFFPGGGLMGADGANATFPDLEIPDTRFNHETGYIQKYAEAPVPPGASRVLVQYVRSTWGFSNYAKPYSVVVDTPHVLAADPGGVNGLTPNEFTIRVWVDNTRGFSTVNREVPLNDVKVRLTLPTGLSLVPGESVQKIIPVVDPREAAFVEWDVVADGQTFGDLPFTAIVDPIPGPAKTIKGSITVAATPRLRLVAGANLITTPFIFLDSSWEHILGLNTPSDFQAFAWNSQQNGYLVSASAQRASGTFILTDQDFGSIALAGNPTTPNDAATGAPLYQLHQGWNLVGNPYNYQFPLGQIVGVSGANPLQAFTWAELVSQGFVGGALAYWDAETQSYKYIQGIDAILEPNRGYWVYLYTVQDLTVSWPAIFQKFLPGSSRSSGPAWTQTDKQWRLQLVARNNSSLDDQNYVGIAKSTAEARNLRILKPPMSPTQKVGVAVESTIDGRTMRMAQELSDRAGRQEWKVLVDVKEAGPVTITWPNVSTTPRNLRFRIEDVATGMSRDLRQASGLTFTMNEPGTREFRVQVDTGSVSRAVIGNVVVARPGRDGNAPFTINYTLSTDATTTVRILSGAGKEIFTVSRGRADRAGENTVTWALRDNANVAVAPGAYRVEILAETPGGDRVRKIIPINVVR